MRAIPVWNVSPIGGRLSEPCFQGENKERSSTPNPFLSRVEGGERWCESSQACC